MTRDPRDVEQIEALSAQLREVLSRLDAALAQNAQLTDLVAKLNERVAELLPITKRKKSKPRPAAPTAQEPPPKLDVAAQKAFDERPRPPPKPEKPESAKRSTKPSGRKPIAAHLEAETHELRPDVCAGCGSAKLDVVDEVVEEKQHVVKEHQRRRVVKRKTCRCRACGERTAVHLAASRRSRSRWLKSWWWRTPAGRKQNLRVRCVRQQAGGTHHYAEHILRKLAPHTSVLPPQ